MLLLDGVDDAEIDDVVCTNDDTDSALDALLEAMEAVDGKCFTIIAILKPNCVSYIFQKLMVVMKPVIVTMIPGVYYLNEMLKVSI